MRKRYSIFLIVGLFLLLLPLMVNAATIDSGECGNDVVWTLDDTGTLTITGLNYMTSHPWTENEEMRDSIRRVIIENGVKNIYDNAFDNCGNLSEVTIPGSVLYIGGSAFTKCGSLVTVSIPSTVTRIDGGAFRDCVNLTSVVIPDGITKIESSTFEGCNSLETINIPDSVTYIDWYAFRGSGLKTLTIPDSVTSMGWCAFEFCSNLESVIIPGSLAVVPELSFMECKNLVSVFIGEGVSCIQETAFSGCNRLVNLVLPESLTSIGGGAFRECSSLEHVSFSGKLSSIGDGAFEKCLNLKTVVLQCPKTNIGGNAFKDCFELESISIPRCNVRAIEQLKNDGLEGKLRYTTADIGLCSSVDIEVQRFAGGNAIEPDLTVFYGDRNGDCLYFETGTDYILSYQNNINAGTATVIATGINNFTGTLTATYTIAPVELDDATVITIKEQVYTGRAIIPAMSVKYNGWKMKKGRDYTVACKKNTNPGIAKATITGIGNYTGKWSTDFVINPKTVELSSLKAGKNQLTVRWKKGKSITGYEIQYSTKKKFKNAETVVIPKAKTNKTVIKELKKGKTYYVRIRAFKTVGEQILFSKWSKPLNMKVK